MKITGMEVLMLLVCCQAAAQSSMTPTYIAQNTVTTGVIFTDTSRAGIEGTDIPLAGSNALNVANSLIQAFQGEQWADYLDLTCPGMVSYYGGRKGFLEYLRRSRALAGDLDKQSMAIELVQLHEDGQEWQCVIRKFRETRIDDRPVRVISYLLGQSTDGGNNWKYVDIAYNSRENLVYIMPDIFSVLVIPQRQIVFLPDDARAAR